ncbi:MAG: bifunctional DNA-formamidopyrimidine glycosylase/DNA-(apurinic or apyrimidinic site) lyase [bacterium]|nr:bifunctional DNA-formamidopyrimidine glycosylase/DNA-(apurinic or apyrimidinic site) lyase [bacterium]
MPELPEVETIKNDLQDKIIGKKIISIFPLWKEIVKDIPFDAFAGQVEGQKIAAVERRAKNLIIKLSGGLSLLIHLKMTGHFLLSEDSAEVSQDGRWIKAENKNLTDDKQNQYVRIIFRLDNGQMLAMSDLRKFAYIKLVDDKELKTFLDKYGPEPFDKDFTAEKLGEILSKKKTAIKKVLMDQSQIAGIGNIYADEILWASRVHPLSLANKLPKKDVEAIYKHTKKILSESLKRRGTSTSDFRDTSGQPGTFGDFRNVYRRTDLPCPVCGGPIRRISLGGRGTHFCPTCQKETK